MSGLASLDDLESLKRQLQTYDDIIPALRQAFAASEQQNAELRAQLSGIESRNSDIYQLKEENASLKAMIEGERASKEAAQQALATMEIDLDSSRRENQALQTCLLENTGKIQDLQAGLEAATRELQALRQDNSSLSAERVSALSLIRDSQAEVQRQRAAAERAVQELASAERELLRRQDELSTVEARAAGLDSAKIQLEGEIRLLELRMNETSGLLAEERTKVAALMTENSRLGTELQTQIAIVHELEDLTSRLRGAAAGESLESDRLRQKLSQREAENESCHQEVNSLRQALGNLMSDINSLRGENASLSGRLAEVESETARQRSRAERAAAEVSTLTRELVRARLGAPPSAPSSPSTTSHNQDS